MAAPIAGVAVTPKMVAGKKPVLRPGTDQEGGEEPLRAEKQAQENRARSENQKPIAPQRCTRLNPAPSQVNSYRRDYQQERKRERHEMIYGIVNRAQARLTGKER